MGRDNAEEVVTMLEMLLEIISPGEGRVSWDAASPISQADSTQCPAPELFAVPGPQAELAWGPPGGWLWQAGTPGRGFVAGRAPLAPEQIKARGIYLPAGRGTPALSEGAFHPY